jgi:hypothetical protein
MSTLQLKHPLLTMTNNDRWWRMGSTDERMYVSVETDIWTSVTTLTLTSPPPPTIQSALGLKPDLCSDKPTIYVLLCSLNTSKPKILLNDIYKLNSRHTEYTLHHNERPNSLMLNLEIGKYGSRDPSLWPRDTLYPQKLALTSPIGGGHSVGIVSPRTQATEVLGE